MKREQAIQFLTGLFESSAVKNLAEHIKRYHHSDLLGHYKGQTFTVAELIQQLTSVGAHITQWQYDIEDLVVVDNLLISIIRFSWIQNHKTYHELLLNLVYRLVDGKVQEMWVMVEQETIATKTDAVSLRQFEVNEKDKAAFLRRLATVQSLQPDMKQKLSTTEQECLYYYLNGFSSKEAAKMLQLTYRTVESYIAAIKARYGCSNKHELRKKLFPKESL